MELISLTIAFVVLFGLRIGMEYLADKYEFFGQWLTITTIALIVVTLVLVVSLGTYLLKRFAEAKKAFPTKGETPQEQAAQRKKSRERGNAREERKENRARRAANKQAERDKIYRVEAFEKRLKK